MAEQYTFLQLFPCCEGLKELCGGLDTVKLTAVAIDKAAGEMTVEGFFPRLPAPAELTLLTDRLREEYALNRVEIAADFPKPKSVSPKDKPKTAGDVLMGRAVKGKPVAMETLGLESGNVTVQGRVFSVDSREIARTKAAVLSFCLTDLTGSIHISKYFRDGDAERGVVSLVKDGMYLAVQGAVGYNRYDDDIALEPRSIQIVPAPPAREDLSAEKRVELHLHTSFSALDALTDVKKAVARAAKWGHKAIAVTDHGCAQAFPDAAAAGAKHGVKIIYGLEGYFVNDVDGKPVLRGGDGGRRLPLGGAFVAFDVETTGLSAGRDRLTEIGAVIIEGGEVAGTFNTFVDPGLPIPAEITRLTGITDADVQGAPDECTALRLFLEFCGGRPLAAHNADFDVGFLSGAAKRAGIDFDPIYLDTLSLAQTLLPKLKHHKLDTVSDYFSLPPFRHHRASDDALAAGRILEKFFDMLREKGAETLGDIDEVLAEARSENARKQSARHIILLVKNKTGLKNLYHLISESYLKHFRRNPIIPKSLLVQYREGLIIGSACESGELFRAMLRHVSDGELKRLAAFYDYLEIQPICNNRFLIEDGTVKDDEGLRDLNRRIARIAKELGKPLVATGDVHFLDPEDEIYRHILLSQREFPDADKPLPIYFKATDEMLEEFSYLGEQECYDAVIANPNAIADQCEEIELLPKGVLFAPKIENSEEELKSLVYGRMRELYGETPPEVVTSRVEQELHDILSRHYDVIYMSAQKLVKDSLDHGYLVGSRGSVGSSIVAYLAGITEVNSLPPHYRCPNCRRSDFSNPSGAGCGADMPDMVCPDCGTPYEKDGFDIPFETFLGFGGDKVPDIDLNFSGEYQANAHRYTTELFGADHVFRAGTIGTLAEKTAYGYVKKYLERRGKTVTRAEENRLALGCVGVKRTTGQHPGGLVIIPQDMDVTDFCPVQHPADDPNSEIITTHFEYHCMEDNLLKLDELGHDDPTMIKMLEDLTHTDARKIPLDDPETMKIFRSPKPLGLPDDDPIIGKTGSMGIPEFGTGFTRQMLVDTQPDGFDILVRLSGFSHGTDVWLGNAQELIRSGTASVKETVGCRDDIMLYLISKGMEPKRAFKFMEAVRKGAIHKGKPWPEGIVEEMRSLGVPEWYIESCRRIQYLFPKAHAVAYVMMAFRIAYFKVHHPLEFYSCYFYRRSQKGAFDAECMTRGVETVKKKIAEIEGSEKATPNDQDLLTTLQVVYEFYLRGFDFAPIDLYESDAARFLPVGERQLRPPFISIPGLGEAAASDLAAAKARGASFVSVEDVSAACPKVSQTHIEVLKSLGALGDLPDTTQMSLF